MYLYLFFHIYANNKLLKYVSQKPQTICSVLNNNTGNPLTAVLIVSFDSWTQFYLTYIEISYVYDVIYDLTQGEGKVLGIAKACMCPSTLHGAVVSVALAAGVSLVSIPQAGDWARVSTPARQYFSGYITTEDWH